MEMKMTKIISSSTTSETTTPDEPTPYKEKLLTGLTSPDAKRRVDFTRQEPQRGTIYHAWRPVFRPSKSATICAMGLPKGKPITGYGPCGITRTVSKNGSIMADFAIEPNTVDNIDLAIVGLEGSEPQLTQQEDTINKIRGTYKGLPRQKPWYFQQQEEDFEFIFNTTARDEQTKPGRNNSPTFRGLRRRFQHAVKMYTIHQDARSRIEMLESGHILRTGEQPSQAVRDLFNHICVEETETSQLIVDYITSAMRKTAANIGLKMMMSTHIVPLSLSLISGLTSLAATIKNKSVLSGISFAASLATIVFCSYSLFNIPKEIKGAELEFDGLIKTFFEEHTNEKKDFGPEQPIKDNLLCYQPSCGKPTWVNFPCGCLATCDKHVHDEQTCFQCSAKVTCSVFNTLPVYIKPKELICKQMPAFLQKRNVDGVIWHSDCFKLSIAACTEDYGDKFLKTVTEESVVDIIKLTGTVACVLIAGGYTIFSGGTISPCKNSMSYIREAILTGLTIGSLTELIAKCFTNGPEAERAALGADIMDLENKLNDFLSTDAVDIPMKSMVDNFEQLEKRYRVLLDASRAQDPAHIGPIMRACTNVFVRAHSKYQTCQANAAGARPRPEPPLHLLYGPPAAGKTNVANNFIKPMVQIMLDARDENVLEMTGTNNFWSDLSGKYIAIMDEYNQTIPTPEFVQQMNALISTTPFKAEGASLELKHQYFMAEFVLAISNRGKFKLPATISEPVAQAFWSRHRFFFVIREGQPVNGARELRSGSNLRIFETDGTTPTNDDYSRMQTTDPMNPSGKVWLVTTLPSWVKKELSLEEYIIEIAKDLMDRQFYFLDSLAKVKRIKDKIPDSVSLVSRYRLPEDWSEKLPSRTLFNEKHPMHYLVKEALAKVDMSAWRPKGIRCQFGRKVDYKYASLTDEQIDGIIDDMSSVLVENSEDFDIDVTALRLSEFKKMKGPADNFPESDVPLESPVTMPPFSGSQRRKYNKAKGGVLFGVTEEMATFPLSISVLGPTNTYKTTTWRCYCKKLSAAFNCSFIDTRSTIPPEPKPNTFYLFDDILPVRAEEFCRFWERCDGSNVLVNTANMPFPEKKRINLTSYFTGEKQYDFSYLSSEKLIKRMGFVGSGSYNASKFNLSGEPAVFDHHGPSTTHVWPEGPPLSEHEAERHFHDMLIRHFNRTPDITWMESLAPAPETEYDFTIRCNLDTYSEITAEIIAMKLVGRSFKDLEVSAPKLSTWSNKSLFTGDAIIPREMPGPHNFHERKGELGCLLYALEQQFDGFKTLIDIDQGAFQIFTTGIKGEAHYYGIPDVTYNLGFDDPTQKLHVVSSRGDSWTLSYDDVVKFEMCVPSTTKNIEDMDLRYALMANRSVLKNHKALAKKFRKIENLLWLQNQKEKWMSRIKSFAAWIFSIKPLRFLLETILVVFLAKVVAKVICYMFGWNAKTCVDPKCTVVHYYTNVPTAEEESSHDFETVKSLNRFYTNRLVPHYTGHEHDQNLLGTWVLHSHNCEVCGTRFFHSHVVHTKEESERFTHTCAKCRKNRAVRAIEEGVRYGGVKKSKRQISSHSGVEKDKLHEVPKPAPAAVAWLATPVADRQYYTGDWSDLVDEEYMEFQPLSDEESIIDQRDLLGDRKILTDAETKVFKNVVHICCPRGGNKGLMISGHLGITVAHALADRDNLWIDSDETGKIPLTVVGIDEQRDIGYFRVNSGKQWPNISKSFVSADDIPFINETRCISYGSDAMILHQAKAAFEKDFPYYGQDGVYKIRTDKMVTWYNVQTTPVFRPGDCGLPYFSSNKSHAGSPIMAIHTNKVSATGQMAGSVVTKEDIAAFIARFAVEETLDESYNIVETPNIPITVSNELGVKFAFDDDSADYVKDALRSKRPTHDFGSPTKLFTVGYNSLGDRPAAATNVRIMPTPWANDIKDFENEAVPAIHAIHYLSPEVQRSLKTDNLSRPSIVATRLADANVPTGTSVAPELRDYVTTSLANYYYSVVEAAQGFRFLNDFQTFNGIANMEDSLYGLHSLEPKASAGLYYSLFYNVQLKGALFQNRAKEGQAPQYWYADTDAGRDLRRRFDATKELLKKKVTLVDFSNVKLKSELRPREKALVGKTRAFESEGILSYLVLKRVFGGLMQGFVKNRAMCHHTGGFDPLTDGPEMYRRMCSFPYLSGRDHTSFDKTIQESLLVDVATILRKMYSRAKDEGHFPDYTHEEIDNIITGSMGYIIYSFENVEGTLAYTKGCVNSGIFLTNWIDSTLVDITQVYACSELGRNAKLEGHELSYLSTPTLRDIHANCDWLTNGDDNLACYSPSYSKFMNFSAVRDYLGEKFGMVVTPPSKDLVTYEFSTFEIETFSSRAFIARDNFVTFALKKSSLERQLFWWTNQTTDVYISDAINSLLVEVACWRDKAYYYKFVNAIKHAFKYDENPKFHREIPIFEDVLYEIKIKQGLLARFGGQTQVYKPQIVVSKMTFKCEFCETETRSPTALNKHKVNSHPKQVVNTVFKCSYCLKTMNADEYRTHEHLGGATCNVCKVLCKSLVNMDNHAQIHPEGMAVFKNSREETNVEGVTMGSPGAAEEPAHSGVTMTDTGNPLSGHQPVVQSMGAFIEAGATVISQLPMSTGGQPPALLALGGRLDTIEGQARTQKVFIKEIVMDDTVSQGAHLGSIAWGDVGQNNFIRTYLDLHYRMTGTINYHVTINGNGTCNGSIIMAERLAVSQADPVPDARSSEAMALNWYEVAVDQVAHYALPLTYYSITNLPWSSTTINTAAPCQMIDFYCGYPLQGGFTTVPKIIVTIWASLGDDFMVSYPRIPSAPKVGAKADADTVSLAAIIGDKSWLVTDKPYTSIFRPYTSSWNPYKESLYQTPHQDISRTFIFSRETRTFATFPRAISDAVFWPFATTCTVAGDVWGAFARKGALSWSNPADGKSGTPLNMFLGWPSVDTFSKDKWLEDFNNSQPHQTMIPPTNKMYSCNSASAPTRAYSYYWPTMGTGAWMTYQAGPMADTGIDGQVDAAYGSIVVDSVGYSTDTFGNSFCQSLVFQEEPSTLVADTAAIGTVSAQPGVQTGKLIDYMYNRFGVQDTSFDIYNARTGTVVANVLWSYSVGGFYVARRNGEPLEQVYVNTNMTDFFLRNFKAVSNPSNTPPPKNSGGWEPRLVTLTKEDKDGLKLMLPSNKILEVGDVSTKDQKIVRNLLQNHLSFGTKAVSGQKDKFYIIYEGPGPLKDEIMNNMRIKTDGTNVVFESATIPPDSEFWTQRGFDLLHDDNGWFYPITTEETLNHNGQEPSPSVCPKSHQATALKHGSKQGIKTNHGKSVTFTPATLRTTTTNSKSCQTDRPGARTQLRFNRESRDGTRRRRQPSPQLEEEIPTGCMMESEPCSMVIPSQLPPPLPNIQVDTPQSSDCIAMIDQCQCARQTPPWWRQETACQETTNSQQLPEATISPIERKALRTALAQHRPLRVEQALLGELYRRARLLAPEFPTFSAVFLEFLRTNIKSKWTKQDSKTNSCSKRTNTSMSRGCKFNAHNSETQHLWRECPTSLDRQTSQDPQ